MLALDSHMNALRGRTSAHTGRPLSPRTRQLFFNTVRAALTAAVRKKVLPVNPATGIEVKGTASGSWESAYGSATSGGPASHLRQ